MTDLRTATNPETGEQVVEIDGQWRPLGEMRTATNQETGERAIEVDGKWQRIGPAAVNTNEGGSFKERATASLKMTPQGRLQFVQSIVGPDNAFLTPNNDVAFRRAENENFRPFDAAGLDLGDIADLAGPALEAIPGAIAGGARQTPIGRLGTAGSAIVRSAVADSGGNVVRQLAAESVAGDDGLSAGDRARSLAGAAAAGAVGQGIADHVVAPAARGANPRNAAVVRPLQEKVDTPFARKGQRLSAQTSIPLTLGQETGSRRMLMLEAAARQHPVSADVVANADQQAIRAGAQRLERLATAISAREGEENTGRALIQTIERASTEAIELRSNIGRRDFSVVDSLAGREPIIRVDNFRSELDSLIASNQTIGSNPKLRALQKLKRDFERQVGRTGGQVSGRAEQSLTEILQNTTNREPIAVSGSVFQNTLSLQGKAAQGKGQIFSDLPTADQRRIAARLQGALLKDLDAAIEGGGAASDLGSALRIARDNWAANTQQITELADSALGRLIDARTPLAPEQVAQRVAKLPLSELRQAVGFLETTNPEAASMLGRYLLDEMLEAATVTGATKRANGLTFSTSRFNTQMLNPKKAARLRTVLSRRDFVEVKRVSKALERVNDVVLRGAQTGPYQETMEFLRASLGAVANPTGLTGLAAKAFAVRRVALVMSDPTARQAFLTVSEASRPTLQSAQAAATLAAILADDMLLEQQGSSDVGRVTNQALGDAAAASPRSTPFNDVNRSLAGGAPGLN